MSTYYLCIYKEQTLGRSTRPPTQALGSPTKHIEQAPYTYDFSNTKYVIDPGNTYFGGSPHRHIHGFRDICRRGDSQNNVFRGYLQDHVVVQSVRGRFVSKCMVSSFEAWVGGLVERPKV
jgi:hypothetical protein